MKPETSDALVKYLPVVLVLASIVSLFAVANAQLGELKKAVDLLQAQNLENVRIRTTLEQQNVDFIRSLNEVKLELVEIRKASKSK